MFERSTLRRLPDNTWKIQGVEHGRLTIHDDHPRAGAQPDVVTEDGKHPATWIKVFKEDGHKFWSGRGEQSYARAEFHVLQVQVIDADTIKVWRVLATFPVTKKR